MLHTGKTSLGPLSVESDFRASLPSPVREDSLFLAMIPDEGLVLRTLPFLGGIKSSSLNLGSLAEGMEEATAPDSLAGVWRLLNSLAEHYPSADFGDVAKPELLSVQLVGSSISSVSVQERQFTPKGPPSSLTEESVRAWTDCQLETMRKLVYDQSHEREA